MACILAGLIVFSAVAKSVAPPPWLVRSTAARTNAARIALIIAESAIVAGLLAAGWMATATAAVFGAGGSWWRAEHVLHQRKECGCFGARQPWLPGASWRNRTRAAVLLTCTAGSIMTAALPAETPHSAIARIGLLLAGAAAGQLLWPLKDLRFTTDWLRQNTDPAVSSVILWNAPVNIRFGLQGATVTMLAATDPPVAKITIRWLPAPLPNRRQHKQPA